MSRRVLTSETVENYLKAILSLEAGEEGASASSPASGRRVALGDVAHALRVTPGTVTSMVKRLARSGLAKYERYGGVTLTVAGRRRALAILRRHRIVETFLVETLGLDWSEVHIEAERLEHALSDRVLDRIDAFLKRPRTDPHGDPIPRADGSVERRSLRSLAATEAGSRVRVAQLLDQSSDFLRFAARHGLRPGARIEVMDADSTGGSVVIKAARHAPVPVSRAVAAGILVESPSSS